MADKKKERKSKYCKAGEHNRKPHSPVFRKKTVRDDKGEEKEILVECAQNKRYGKGCHKAQRYTGNPYTYFC